MTWKQLLAASALASIIGVVDGLLGIPSPVERTHKRTEAARQTPQGSVAIAPERAQVYPQAQARIAHERAAVADQVATQGRYQEANQVVAKRQALQDAVDPEVERAEREIASQRSSTP